ncbi:MAG TPA: VWA domain-containing protein [Aggregatilineales bacterium]|nr:VWA domain-containing protein [Anaerolineales bacterium]HRE46562.1 VWA domain-containing protein [Aggregatilineales bacterium]
MDADQFVRRRPVYLLLDVSGSMQGAPIQAVQQGVIMIHNELMNNPHSIETVYLSVIVFGNSARQIVTLTSVESFTPPILTAGGSTALGASLTLLDQALEREIRSAGEGRKGDYRPLIFLFTDGAPTDEWRAPLATLKTRKLGSFVALGCGNNVNVNVLKEITPVCLLMSDTSGDAIRQFFRWVSSSIQKTSQRINTKAEENGLEIVPLPPIIKRIGDGS